MSTATLALVLLGIAAVGAVLLALITLRAALILRGMRGGWPGRAVALLLAQLSALGAAAALVLRDPVHLIGLALPEIWLLALALTRPDAPVFLGMIWPKSLACAAVAGALILAVRPLRLFAPLGAGLALAGAALWIGEAVSRDAMCRTARALGAEEIRRNTLLWSLANTPREFQVEIHAILETEGARLGWSYGEMGWYEIPGSDGEVMAPPLSCSEAGS